MAAPNIFNSTTIYGRMKVVNLTTTSSTSVLSNAASSNTVYKVNFIRATNINGTAPADITLTITDSSSGQVGYLAYTISIPQDTTLTLVAREDSLYIEEGDTIEATSSIANYISIVASYEEIY